MKIIKPRGRRLVIPDIHGSYLTFKNLLNKIKLRKCDSLYLLGDYINRGPRSKEVLDMIIDLKNEGNNILPLRGNHEQMLLDSDADFHDLRFVYPGTKKPVGIVDDKLHLVGKYAAFINDLPYYYELDDYLLVHAGFNTKIADPFTDKDSMLWIDSFRYDSSKLHGKRVIHGHNPFEINEVLNSISQNYMVVPLDNGVFQISSDLKGNLLCLELDSMVLIRQRNIDI